MSGERPRGADPGPRAANTTLGVVANARLTKEDVRRFAVAGNDAFDVAIRPAHTIYDGDTVFALATQEVEASFDDVVALAEPAVTTAIRRAVTTDLPAVVTAGRRSEAGWRTDVLLYGCSALFAAATAVAADIPLQRTWGETAVWGYGAATAVAAFAWFRGRRAETESARVRGLLAAVVFVAVALVPLLVGATRRADIGPGSHAQSEVIVVEEAADVALGPEPVRGRVRRRAARGASSPDADPRPLPARHARVRCPAGARRTFAVDGRARLVRPRGRPDRDRKRSRDGRGAARAAPGAPGAPRAPDRRAAAGDGRNRRAGPSDAPRHRGAGRAGEVTGAGLIGAASR